MKKATIEILFDQEIGELLLSKDYFAQHDEADSFQYRRLLKDQVINGGNPRYVCAECFEPLLICGSINQKMHFEHRKDSPECELKTKGTFTHEEINRRKFNGAKESQLHLNIKDHLYTYLKEDPLCSEVHKEKVVQMKDVGRDRWWKKPDISAIFKDQEIVIEIQLSTTFLDVIVDREAFYKTKGSYILWVFDERELEQYRYSEKDIFYTHNRNAFIVSEASKRKTQETGILHFDCRYQVPSFDVFGKQDEWVEKIVSIHDLKFDSQNYHLIYHDYQAQLKILEEQNAVIEKQIELENQKLRAEAIVDFEHYWVEERDHDMNNETNIDQDHQTLEPLLEQLSFHLCFPLDYRINNLLNVIFHIKTNKKFCYNMKLISVLNMALNAWPQHGVLFVQALGVYDRWDELKGISSFRAKVKNIQDEWTDKQDGQYNEFLALFFPKVIEKFDDHIIKYL